MRADVPVAAFLQRALAAVLAAAHGPRLA